MSKIQITLVDKQREEVAKLSIDQEVIADAACVVYGGTHYIYSGNSGRFFTGVVFMQVNPPVKLTKANTMKKESAK